MCNWDATKKNQSDCAASLVDRFIQDSSAIAQKQIDEQSHFCAVCDSPSTCISIDWSEVGGIENCEGRQVCVVDGKIILDVDSESCQTQYGSCSIACPDCTSAEACKVAGICSDQEIIEYWKLAIEHVGSESIAEVNTTGYCAYDMAEWNSPDCAWASSHPTNVPIGLDCIILADFDFCQSSHPEPYQCFSLSLFPSPVQAIIFCSFNE